MTVELHVDSEVVVRNTQIRVDCSNINRNGMKSKGVSMFLATKNDMISAFP